MGPGCGLGGSSLDDPLPRVLGDPAHGGCAWSHPTYEAPSIRHSSGKHPGVLVTLGLTIALTWALGRGCYPGQRGEWRGILTTSWPQLPPNPHLHANVHGFWLSCFGLKDERDFPPRPPPVLRFPSSVFLDIFASVCLCLSVGWGWEPS